MSSRHKRLTIGISLLVMFCIGQVYLAGSFAGSDPRTVRPRQVRLNSGILITSGKQAILVNGINAVTDATVMSGSSLETPQGVSATVNLGGLGRVDIAPSANLRLDFSDSRITVTLARGCVVVLTKGMVVGTIETPNGIVGGTRETSKGQGLDVCQVDGKTTPLVNQGAAANAGAGAGSGGAAATIGTPTVTAAAGGGLNPALSVFIAASLIIPMTVAAVLLNNCDRGTNPSPELNTKCL